jgi:hypothetical protein
MCGRIAFGVLDTGHWVRYPCEYTYLSREVCPRGGDGSVCGASNFYTKYPHAGVGSNPKDGVKCLPTSDRKGLRLMRIYTSSGCLLAETYGIFYYLKVCDGC